VSARLRATPWWGNDKHERALLDAYLFALSPRPKDSDLCHCGEPLGWVDSTNTVWGPVRLGYCWNDRCNAGRGNTKAHLWRKHAA